GAFPPNHCSCVSNSDGELPSHQSRIVTSPVPPLTRKRWPVLITVLADPVAVTAGNPYSRHTMAACDMIPPMSVTVALIFPNTGAQLGAVTGATRISPFLT